MTEQLTIHYQHPLSPRNWTCTGEFEETPALCCEGGIAETDLGSVTCEYCLFLAEYVDAHRELDGFDEWFMGDSTGGQSMVMGFKVRGEFMPGDHDIDTCPIYQGFHAWRAAPGRAPLEIAERTVPGLPALRTPSELAAPPYARVERVEQLGPWAEILSTWYLAEEFLHECRARGLAETTIRTYAGALRKFFRYAGNFDATHDVLVDFLVDARRRHQQATVAFLWGRLRQFYGWRSEVYAVRNPTTRIGNLRRPSSLPRVLSLAEINQLVKACATERDRLLVAIFLDTGLRVGEVGNMRKADLVNDTLTVRGKTGERQVPVSDRLAVALLGIGDEKYFWLGHKGSRGRGENPLTTDAIMKVIQKYLRQVNPEAGRRYGPHTLRHTFGTMYIRLGGKVTVLQKILGHANIEQTMMYVSLATSDTQDDHAANSPAARLGLLDDLGLPDDAPLEWDYRRGLIIEGR